jgi:alkyl hydroperoxide reductase subunit AhpC
MLDFIQIGKIAPNFITIGVYKNRLGKIRLSDYHGKKYVILIFYPANFTSISATELINLSDRILNFENYQHKFLQFLWIVHFHIFIIYFQTKSRWIRPIKLSFNF